MFAVKTELVKALLRDVEWPHRLENANTMREVESVLREFALEKGWKVKDNLTFQVKEIWKFVQIVKKRRRKLG